MSLELKITKKSDFRLITRMKNHYSKPEGFVGRSICYAIHYNKFYYGHIVAGSAVQSLPGRDSYFNYNYSLNSIINNVFYSISRFEGKYPVRNFTTKVLKYFMNISKQDWENKYGDRVIGFETLIELPRTGELYKRAGWTCIGTTKGFTCKRKSGYEESEKYTGKRVWDYENLRPKLVFCYKD